MVVADQDLPREEACTVGVSLEMKNVDQKNMETRGSVTLFINEQPVGQQEISTQLGQFSVAGEPFTVGRCAGTGRNVPCPCGSGLKTKQCHGRKRTVKVPKLIRLPVHQARPRARVVISE
jgi:uncharacterized protein YchJ